MTGYWKIEPMAWSKRVCSGVIHAAEYGLTSSSHTFHGFEHAAHPLPNGDPHADLRFGRTMRTYETGLIQE
jgi:hypothetical protein